MTRWRLLQALENWTSPRRPRSICDPRCACCIHLGSKTRKSGNLIELIYEELIQPQVDAATAAADTQERGLRFQQAVLSQSFHLRTAAVNSSLANVLEQNKHGSGIDDLSSEIDQLINLSNSLLQIHREISRCEQSAATSFSTAALDRFHSRLSTHLN